MLVICDIFVIFVNLLLVHPGTQSKIRSWYLANCLLDFESQISQFRVLHLNLLQMSRWINLMCSSSLIGSLFILHKVAVSQKSALYWLYYYYYYYYFYSHHESGFLSHIYIKVNRLFKLSGLVQLLSKLLKTSCWSCASLSSCLLKKIRKITKMSNPISGCANIAPREYRLWY